MTYCEDIGVAELTGYRWLEQYFPQYYASIERGKVTNVTIPLPEGKFDIILADPPYSINIVAF